MRGLFSLTATLTALSNIAQCATAAPCPSRSSSCNLSAQYVSHSGCSASAPSVRKEWNCHNDAEKLDFINSVKCMMAIPHKTPSSAAPGARSRYDDFLLTHINSTFHVHVSGVFLPWHRRFLSLFEQAMREECGYGGHIPYMYWPNYADDLAASTLFDGSPTSLGSNGYLNASNPSVPNGNYNPPKSDGGGCISSGPFANITSPFRNFPPVGKIFSLPANALDYNPHCIRRNFNTEILASSNNKSEIERLLSEPDIINFQHRIDSIFYPNGRNIPDYGIHAGGHAAIGGDFTDFFASPGDPIFWLHHAMVDNLWTTWQARDPPNRQFALNGTDMLQNNPAGQTVTVDYRQNFGYLDHAWRVGDLMDVTKGPFCYRYE